MANLISRLSGFVLVLFLPPSFALAEPKAIEPLDSPVFRMPIDEKLQGTRWRNGPSDPRAVNALITSPCFEYAPETPYCMPKNDGDKGFVCSGQSATMVAYFRSLGIPAVPLYLEWQTPKDEKEAHAMVAVPFTRGKETCHHIIEAARTWPRQPVVEFACCGADLRQCALNHFTNPPDREKAERAGVPFRTPLVKDLNERKFEARLVDKAYDLKDPYNPGSPIWTLTSGKWDCPKGLCTKHSVAPFIQIDQSGVKPGAPETFQKTFIEVDYSRSQAYACKQTCPKENCILASTGRQAPLDHNVEYPPARASCSAAAGMRAQLAHPRFTCQSICETPRPDEGYRGGTYRFTADEPAMRCETTGPVIHRVRRPEERDARPRDGSELPRRDGGDHTVR